MSQLGHELAGTWPLEKVAEIELMLFGGPFAEEAALTDFTIEGVGVAAKGGAAIEGAAAESNFVYRGLAEGEDITNGLVARAPNAGNTPISHVAGMRDSQWISTTKSEATAPL